MRTGVDVLKRRAADRGVTLPDDVWPEDLFTGLGLPLVVECTDCGTTMAFPSALVDGAGFTYCAGCADETIPFETQPVDALRATLPLLVRLGDFIGNAEGRCDVILAVKEAIAMSDDTDRKRAAGFIKRYGREGSPKSVTRKLLMGNGIPEPIARAVVDELCVGAPETREEEEEDCD